MSSASSSPIRRVLVTGGAGYVGGVLVPRLLASGYDVRVLDLYFFGDRALAAVAHHPGLEQVRADVRDTDAVRAAMAGIDAVIHLACISNDPSCDLDPALSRTINYDAFEPLVVAAKEAGVRRFVFASSSSVYGVSDSPSVTEDHPLLPITDYNRFKGMCEEVLFRHEGPGFTTVSIRPATVCGYSPRQRLDLVVNILTTQAVERGRVTVFGGAQQRPNIHIEDMVDLYLRLLTLPAEALAGQAFNIAHENHTVSGLAELVKRIVESEIPERAPIEIVTTESNDPRSYHICCDKARERLGFVPRRGIEDAVRDLVAAFRDGRLPHALEDSSYYNVKRMKELALR